MYADDLLLSASVSGLQRILDICYRFGMQNSTVYNENKSICIMVSKNKHKPIEQLTLGNMTLEWVNSFKYLELVFNFGCSLHFENTMVHVTAF